MFSRRIMGVLFVAGLSVSPWTHVYAQENAVPGEIISEAEVHDPVVPEDPVVTQAEAEQIVPAPTELMPLVEGAEGNDPNRLESIGVDIADAKHQELTAEQVAALSEVDKQDMVVAGLIWENVTTEEVTVEEALEETREANDLGSDCDPTRFYNCSFYRVTLQHCAGTILRPKCTEIGKRWFLFRVDNHMSSTTTAVTAQSYVIITHKTGAPLPEVITFTLRDENDEPISTPMHASTIDIEKTYRYNLGKLALNVPYRKPGEPPVSQYADLQTSFTNSDIELDVTQSARIRCSRAWSNSTMNCVNPDAQPILTFDRQTFPYIADNISSAIAKGKPNVLTRDNREVKANRDAACPRSQQLRLERMGPKPTNMARPSCDEYPFASSQEGGENAQVMWVPSAENTAQGQTIFKFLQEQQVQNNDKYRVEVIP